MRAIECNTCGEPLSAHDDDALVRCLCKHVQSAHPELDYDEARAREDVEAEAYSASDN